MYVCELIIYPWNTTYESKNSYGCPRSLTLSSFFLSQSLYHLFFSYKTRKNYIEKYTHIIRRIGGALQIWRQWQKNVSTQRNIVACLTKYIAHNTQKPSTEHERKKRISKKKLLNESVRYSFAWNKWEMEFETRSSSRTTMRVIFLWLISFDIHRHRNMTRCFTPAIFAQNISGWCMDIKCDDNVVWIKFRIAFLYLYLELSKLYVYALFSIRVFFMPVNVWVYINVCMSIVFPGYFGFFFFITSN